MRIKISKFIMCHKAAVLTILEFAAHFEAGADSPKILNSFLIIFVTFYFFLPFIDIIVMHRLNNHMGDIISNTFSFCFNQKHI
jgi:hypothetical protein